MDVYIWNRTNATKRLMFGSYPCPGNLYAQNTSEFVTIYVKEGKPDKRSKKTKEQNKLTIQELVKYTQQIWDIPVPSKSDIAYDRHPAIMPRELAKRCILLYSLVGDTVLDPFTGSGTTLQVAQALKRHYVGYEINEAYKTLIEKRLSA